MAWRKITEADIAAHLSRREMEAFSRSADFGDEVLKRHVTAIVAKVRNYISCSGAARLAPQPDMIPESLVADAMAIVRYDLLLRYDIAPNEARKAARDAALETLQQVADGRLLVEPPDDSEPPSKAVTPAAGAATPARLLD